MLRLLIDAVSRSRAMQDEHNNQKASGSDDADAKRRKTTGNRVRKAVQRGDGKVGAAHAPRRRRRRLVPHSGVNSHSRACGVLSLTQSLGDCAE